AKTRSRRGLHHGNGKIATCRQKYNVRRSLFVGATLQKEKLFPKSRNMKKISLLMLFLGMTSAFAQSDSLVAKDTIKYWTLKGNASFLFTQSTFDNWIAGGENNISGNIGVNYDANYSKDDWNWDNKIIASYGLVKTKSSSFAKKTDDRLEFNSLVGKRVKRDSEWYYSGFLNFRTQFTKGYNYFEDENGTEIREE